MTLMQRLAAGAAWTALACAASSAYAQEITGALAGTVLDGAGHPVSGAQVKVTNLSTSAGMEDYNSFGAHAALKARRVIERASDVVAIELLCAAEALEYQRPLRSGPGVEQAFATVRSVVSRRTRDRPPAPDIQAIKVLIARGCFSG